MTHRLHSLAASVSAALAAGALAGALPSGAAAGVAEFWNAVVDTTPAGLVRPAEERPGDWQPFWSDTKEGAMRIMDEGKTLWVVPAYTNHPKWEWDNKPQQNGYPFGMGIARQVIDERGNERMLFLTSFVDSNYRMEPMAGYAWLSRWPIGGGFHVGAGYLAGLTMRGDYMWVPLPLPLPVASIGNDTVSVYGTWVPFTNVFFFFTSIAIDDVTSRKMPLPADSPWVKTPNLLFGGWGWQYVDNGAEDGETPNFMTNDSVWNVGLRHYSGRNWQTEFKYKKSRHDVKSGEDGRGGREKIDIETYSLTIAYNIDVAKNFRLYAGGGFGFSHASSSAGSDNSIHPVLTMGATWAFSPVIHLTASMDTNISRFKGVTPGRDDSYLMKPMPTEFMVNLGFAF